MSDSAPMARLGVAAGVCVAALLVWSGAAPAQTAHEKFAGIPDFRGHWTRDGENPSTFEMPQSGPHAIDTVVPHYGHCVVLPEGVQLSGGVSAFACPEGVDARASNAWIADYTNPILQPWARQILRKYAEDEARGVSHMSDQQNCLPSGVPQVFNLRYVVNILQSPDVTMILYENNQWHRRVDMNQEHSEYPSSTWYGESVGHYEDDTLVIDTIGQTGVTGTDRFGTPHTDQIHVVERYRLLDDGRMRVEFTVDDPGAFTMAWVGVATYRRVDYPFGEYICYENNRGIGGQVFDTPIDETPDF